MNIIRGRVHAESGGYVAAVLPHERIQAGDLLIWVASGRTDMDEWPEKRPGDAVSEPSRAADSLSCAQLDQPKHTA